MTEQEKRDLREWRAQLIARHEARPLIKLMNETNAKIRAELDARRESGKENR